MLYPFVGYGNLTGTIVKPKMPPEQKQKPEYPMTFTINFKWDD